MLFSLSCATESMEIESCQERLADGRPLPHVSISQGVGVLPGSLKVMRLAWVDLGE